MKNLRKASVAWLVVALLSATLIACGTLEVSVERTPTPDQSATATLSALATENARLATQMATLAASTPPPTPSLGKLAYVQGGDIWVKTLPDGEPRRLTTDGRNSQPRWSPSGEWLAFRKGEFEQVWVMRADGTEARSLQAVPNGAFAWSPIADRLAYADGDRLKVVNADGTDPVTLVTGPSVTPPTPPPLKENTVGRIAWSPDGAWIAYEWVEQQPKQPLTYQGLWKVSANGEQVAELYASGAPEKGEAILAGWSLDGQHILFWQGDILSASMLADGVAFYSLPAGGGEPIKLVDTVLVHSDFIAPAPQGDRLAVTAGGYRATWTRKGIAVVGAGGGELTWLTNENVAAFSPAWSPDGAHLAYAAMPDEGDLVGGEDARLGIMKRRIWVVSVQGETQPHQLTDDPAYRDERPLWSADGSHILFARLDAEDRASLWLIPAGGGDPRRVVEELTPAPGWFGYYGHVEWDQLFDWWRGPARTAESAVVPTSASSPPTTQFEAPLALLYRQGEALYAWDEAANQRQRLLDLPDIAGHLALSPLGYLAYTVDDTVYLADLSAGTARELYGAWGRAAPDWDLRWCTEGRVLAYALAYEEQEPEAARHVELGTHDGYAQRVIATLTARSGPLPTPPPMPPAPPEPGFANLHLLGYDRISNTLVAIPVGGQERYSSVWVVNALNGERLKTVPLDNPDQISSLALSPDLAHLALCRVGNDTTQSRLELYDMTGEESVPAIYELPPHSHAVDLHWSPDGASLAYLLAEGQPSLEVSSTAALWLLDVSQLSSRELSKLESPEARLIGWAPEPAGHLLVAWLEGFSRQEHYQLVDIASGEVTDLPLPSGADVLGWTRLAARRISFLGKQFLSNNEIPRRFAPRNDMDRGLGV